MGKDVRFTLLAEVPEGMTIAEYASALERRANALSGMAGVTVTWTRPHEPGTEPLADAPLAELSDDDFREQLRGVVLEAARRRFDVDAAVDPLQRRADEIYATDRAADANAGLGDDPVDLAGERQYREELAAGRDPRD